MAGAEHQGAGGRIALGVKQEKGPWCFAVPLVLVLALVEVRQGSWAAGGGRLESVPTRALSSAGL